MVLSAAVFKANDIRGRAEGPHPEWDVEAARLIGNAFVQVLGPAGASVIVGRDMRTSGEEMSAAFIDGARTAGADIVDLGLVSSDALWYASGVLKVPGAMFTASHNPAEDNGVKFCLAGAAPVTPTMLTRIRDLSLAGSTVVAERVGALDSRSILADYGAYLRSRVDLDGWRPLRVVVDAGNGMAGLTTPVVLGPLDLEINGLYFDLDGTFPHHMPNPLIPENLVDARAEVRRRGADLGLVFDGDADRCFVLDERGEVVSPSVVTALIARQELVGEPGGTIVVNTITSRSVADEVVAAGGRIVVSPVGHTAVKAHMAAHGAVFGGEHSAHYYFRDFWGADTGMLAALHMLSMLGRSSGSMSALAAQVGSYAGSGEINLQISDVGAATARIEAAFAGRGRAAAGDGLTVSGEGWWVNVRASNTEPLVRLNVEAGTSAEMIDLRDEALSILREGSHDD
ncbi:MAG: phosphomannomutase/phosphoglucomutase [Propioniciclava sp.]